MVRRLLRHDDPELPERLPGSPTISSRVERHRHLGRVGLHSSEPDRRRAVARGAARARDVTLCTPMSRTFAAPIDHHRRAGRARHTAARLRSVSSSDALSLWRGPVLEDLGPPEFASTEAARHDELRLVALDHGIDADLALGQHHAVIPELRLVIEHPFRERLHCRLILALYRAGRQADALAVSASVRR